MVNYDRRWPLRRLIILSGMRFALALTCFLLPFMMLGSYEMSKDVMTTIRAITLWIIAVFELITLLAQCICFLKGNLKPKQCTHAQAWALLLYQIQFVFFCLALEPWGAGKWVQDGMKPTTAVAWTSSLMMFGTACLAVHVYTVLMCYQVWKRTAKPDEDMYVEPLKTVNDEEDFAEVHLPSSAARQPSYTREAAAGLPNYITERLTGLPRYSVIVIPPGASVSVTTESKRGVSMATVDSTQPPRSISVSSTMA